MSTEKKLALIKKKVVTVLAFAVLFGGIAAALSIYVLPKQYQAHVSMIIVRDPSAYQSDLYTDLRAGLELIKDYREIIKTDSILNEVKYGAAGQVPQLQDLPNADMRKKITFDSTTDSRVFTILYQDTDPQVARIVADKLAEVLKQKVAILLQVDMLAIMGPAELPVESTTPDIVVNTSLGFLLGLAGSSLLILFIDYWRNLDSHV